MLTRIAPVLGVNDVDAAVEYYCGTLGFDCPYGSIGAAGEVQPVYAILGRAGTELHLQVRRREIFTNTRESFEGDTYLKFDYTPDGVERVDELHQELSDRGAVIHRGLLNEEYGFRDFTVLTPMGHRLTFGMPLFVE